MSNYDPTVVAAIRRIGQSRYGSDPKKLRRYLLGQYSTGIVESGLRNLSGGDADSYGYRQQRLSGYGRQPLDKQINNLYDEFEQYDRGQTVGQLDADVQRPAAQYRGRYAMVLDQARALADQAGVPGGNATPHGIEAGGSAASSSMAAPQVSASNPFSAIASMSANQKGPYADIMNRGWQQLGQIWQDQHGTPSMLASVGAPASAGPSSGGGISTTGSDSAIVTRANELDAANRKGKLPYLWGGGHGSTPVNPDKPTPVDCSGAVSAVLGINPRVAEQFKTWGRAGEGGKQGITVYAKKDGKHVLMKINGHFFGTSATNAGGGAGWIKQEDISPDYLKNFTARHL